MNKIVQPRSIVAEALASAGTLQKETLDELLEKIRQNIIDARTDVYRIVEQKYGQYLENAVENARHLNAKVSKVAGEIEKIKTTIDAQVKSNVDLTEEKLKQIEEELKSTNDIIASLSSAAELSDLFDAIDDRSNNVTRRAELIIETESKLNNVCKSADVAAAKHGRLPENPDSRYFLADKSALNALHNEFVTQRERLSYELSENWKETIVCDVDEYENRVDLRLLNVTDRQRFNDTLNAMLILSVLNKRVDKFSSFLLSRFYEPLIEEGKSLKFDAINGECMRISIDIRSTGKSTSVEKRDAEKIVAAVWLLSENLIKLLDFKLKRITTDQSKKNFLEYLGSRIAEPILRKLVVDVLKPAVPGERSEIETKKFTDLLSQCSVLEENLKSSKFLTSETRNFESFAADIDVLFLNKRCQTILTEARCLITTNLHNTVEVGVDIDDENEEPTEELLTNIEELLNVDSEKFRELLDNIPFRFDNETRLPLFFRFPKCRVSQTVFDFVKLLIRTLDEACESSRVAAGRLYETARGMLELFVAITPIYHKQALLSMPLLPAIFYNNCYYLAHHLMTLGYEYAPKLLKTMELPSGGMQITFIDFVPKIRDTAAECAELMVTSQKRILTDFINSAEGFTSLNDSEHMKTCNKSLKQCVMQLELLNRIWKPVFTSTVLLKYQGILVGHVFSTLNAIVLDMEDITADDANHVQILFKDILKSLEQLFQIDKSTEIHRFCEKPYLKFKEITFMLSAGLQDVDDRWSSGQGPLAVWMDAEEVKRMIRALFQNNAKRAAVMAKIK